MTEWNHNYKMYLISGLSLLSMSNGTFRFAIRYMPATSAAIDSIDGVYA